MSDPFKTPLFNLHDLIVITTAIAAALMLVMQVVAPSKNSYANRCLTLFFGCLFVHSTCIILLWNEQIAPNLDTLSPLIIVLICGAHLLKGPALFFYISAITQADFNFNRKQLVHLIPALAIIAILLGLGTSLAELKGISDSPYRRLTQDLWLIMRGLPAVYALACIPVALSASHLMQSFYSNDYTTGKNWLSLLCFGYAIYWGWTFLGQLLGGTLSRIWQYQQSFGDILGIANNYMGFGLLMVLFSYSVSVTQQQLGRALSAAKPKNPPKSQPIGDDTLVETIKATMETEKLYLQTNLTAEQFADHLGRATREISTVINQQFGKNFFEFVNGYRVAEAQRLLASAEYSDTSITDILYLAGFNSKSAFQRFFKRNTGMSPSEYRAKAKLSPEKN